ncbi:MAG: serine hydrolase domain-containing protein [Verrucomicrobiota bacterium]|nr:serine hydrolase domain-containing protein [Verrucomicrobiota bacterium]
MKIKFPLYRPVLCLACFVLASFTAVAESSFPELEALVSAADANSKIPGGSVRVVEDREVLFDRYFGAFTEDSKIPWDEQTVVSIASITKSVTATLVAVLAGEGSLSFDDPIAKHLPEYAELTLQNSDQSVRSPTIAECLSHTSGFPGGTMAKLPRNSPIKSGDQAEVARHLATQGLVARPGTKYAYTFRGYAAVSRVIEVVTCRPIAEVMQEKLLAPLGMNETTFTPGVSLVRRHPRFAAQAEGRSDDEVATQIESLRAQRGPFVNTAGALVSTPDDLQRFLQFHANKGRVGQRQIAPASVLAKLYRKQPATKDYGIGFKLLRDGVVGHGGATGTFASVNLKSGRILIVFTQAGTPNARPLTAGATKIIFP